MVCICHNLLTHLPVINVEVVSSLELYSVNIHVLVLCMDMYFHFPTSGMTGSSNSAYLTL